jgi:ABC-2 type transport system permease protein
MIEMVLWTAVFRGLSQNGTLGGFSENYYLAYALWAPFVARINTNWMYEMRMTEEIESGSLNSILVRPFSFFEYYLSQFLGYKLVTTFISLTIPISAALFLDLPIQFDRLPLAFGLIVFYLIFLHLISFCVASVAFHLTRISSLTVAKNFILWSLSGELFPLDLIPAPYKDIFISLPFASAVYIPVGYITGRVGSESLVQGFYSVAISIFILAPIAYLAWQRGLKSYAGTGA